jgi:hypothetical protein
VYAGIGPDTLVGARGATLNAGGDPIHFTELPARP